MYVVGKVGNDWKYVDFKYFNVKYEPATITTTSTHTEGGPRPVIKAFTGPTKFEFSPSFSVVGLYKFSVSVEGGTPPYYYTWKGARAPNALKEGTNLSTIEISPQDMRLPRRF
jgi:hypothetical protein